MRSRVWARGGKAQAPWGPVWLCSGTCSLGASDLTSDGEFTPAGLLSLRLQSRGAMLPAALLQLCTEKAHLSTRLPVITWPTDLGPGGVRRARAPAVSSVLTAVQLRHSQDYRVPRHVPCLHPACLSLGHSQMALGEDHYRQPSCALKRQCPGEPDPIHPEPQDQSVSWPTVGPHCSALHATGG